MAARFILAALAIVFALAAVIRMARNGAAAQPQARIWLLVAAIFAAVSTWLWTRG